MKKIGIIMNGVTGRMGTFQHLERSIIAIRDQGGIVLADGEIVMPDPILVGRNEVKLRSLANRYGVEKWTTNLADALSDSNNEIYFDASSTSLRSQGIKAALDAGKHIYCEKPIAMNFEEALELARMAEMRGVKHGVVQDKLFLPGMLKLKQLVDTGFFGRILSVRGEFGYWVFDGGWEEAQRPSWNYRKEEGGGIISDMLCHWRYVLDHIFGDVKAVSCYGATHIPTRFDESRRAYDATAEDAAYATFELNDGVIVQINSSWCVRVNRDELFELQVDGTHGSAVAGLRNCKVQHRVHSPKPIWNPDIPDSNHYREQWVTVPERRSYENAFKVQWEMYLKHVVQDTPFPHNLFEGAKGVQLAELGLQSWSERRWLNVPSLEG